ncbi:MAG: TonB-dependent receptor [Prevotella sp.]|jgi:TonB-dependent receptor
MKLFNPILKLSILLCLSVFFHLNLSAQNVGKISGKVMESSSGTPLVGCNVFIDSSTGLGASTDEHGAFIISNIKPGRYILRASYIGYEDGSAEVTVTANQNTVVNITLKESSNNLENVIVYGQLSRGQAKALNEQKNSLNLKNVVSSDQFQLFPDRNAAETLSRIPGISISYDQGEGELVQIRGIGPQYNSLTLNGQRIPAPDPDLGRAVGLDLLNQDLFETIIVSKALTPDIDGDAIGGNINLKLKQAPENGLVSAKLAGGYNLQHSYYNEYGKDIVDASAFLGKRFFDKKLGILGGFVYYKTNRGSLLNELEYEDDKLADGIIFAQHFNDYDVLRERTGFNLNTDFRFNSSHKIYLNFNTNRYFDKEIRRLNEWVIPDKKETKETRNRVEDQFLTTVMFGGEHKFNNNIKLDYVGSWIKAKEKMPARTYFRYQRDFDFSKYTNDEIKEFKANTIFDQEDVLTLNRIRVDDNLKEDEDLSGAINLQVPFKMWSQTNSVKLGSKITHKNAKYTARRLQLRNFPEKHTIGEGEFGNINVIVDPDDTNYLGATRSEYLDKSTNNYDATETVSAVYGMTTLNFTDKLSLLAGLRFEHTNNDYLSLAKESVNKEKVSTGYNNFLPSAHLTYKLTKNINLRLAYSSGISRPSYVSLVPFEFIDDEARTISQGNPDLKPTNSNNFDFMFEYYSSGLDFISAGVFYKNMRNIIMKSAIQKEMEYEGKTQIYEVSMPINVDDNANVFGAEVAFNQRLDFIGSSFFKNLILYGNYTFTFAEMDVKGRNVPLGYSPKHIANLALMYDNPKIGLSVVVSNNFRDDILLSVGKDETRDSYFKKEYHLDLSVRKSITKQLSLIMELNNLTDQKEVQCFGKPSKDYSRLQQWANFNSYGTIGVTFKL